MLEKINQNLSVYKILGNFGIEAYEGRRISCPVHQGQGLNFAVYDSGKFWKCHSHNCGSNRKRDSVNLFCLLRFGKALPDLSSSQKSESLKELCSLAGVENSSGRDFQPQHDFNKFDSIPILQRQALAAIFEDTAKLEALGQARFYCQKMQRVILFLWVSKNGNELPAKINQDWKYYENIKERLS